MTSKTPINVPEILRDANGQIVRAFRSEPRKYQLLRVSLQECVTSQEIAQWLVSIASDPGCDPKTRLAAIKTIVDRLEGPVTQRIALGLESAQQALPDPDLSHVSNEDLTQIAGILGLHVPKLLT